MSTIIIPAGNLETEYWKAATKGNWGEVWQNFDRRQAAKVAGEAANDAVEPDLLRSVGARGVSRKQLRFWLETFVGQYNTRHIK